MPNRLLKENIRDYVKRFFDIYRERIDFIVGLPENGEEDRKFEKVLLSCCYIDSLGKYYCSANKPEIAKDNQKRFMEFLLLAKGNYPQLENVWLVGLRLHLEKQHEQEMADYMLNKWPLRRSDFVHLNHNPDITLLQFKAKVQEDLSQSKADRLLNIASDFTYAKVIWERYRNPSVHEGRFVDPLDLRNRNRDKPFTSWPDVYDYENGEEVGHYEAQLGIPPKFLIGCLAESLQRFESETFSTEEKTNELHLCFKEIYDESRYVFRTPNP